MDDLCCSYGIHGQLVYALIAQNDARPAGSIMFFIMSRTYKKKPSPKRHSPAKVHAAFQRVRLFTQRRGPCVRARNPAQGGKTPWRVSSGCRVSKYETLYGVLSPQTLHKVAKPRLVTSQGAGGSTVQCIRAPNTAQGESTLCRCPSGCKLHTCVGYDE